MNTELAHTRTLRGALLRRFLDSHTYDGIDPYQCPRMVGLAGRKAWLTHGLHALVSATFTSDGPLLPLPFGQGRYAAILKTRGMGTFTGTCDTIDEAHCAFADALCAWLEDQGIK